MPELRVAWATDIHLNFVSLKHWQRFVLEIEQCHAEAVLLSGDISEAEDLEAQLVRLADCVGLPIYFVLGNHDFYHGEIAAVRDRVAALCESQPLLHYLNCSGPISLNDEWVLCGDDGWADGRCGDFLGSPVQMNDFELIHDFWSLDKLELRERLKLLGDEAAHRLQAQLTQASNSSNRILILTHVPPVREACWYMGNVANNDWAPFFVCEAMGEMLTEFCLGHAEHKVLVLCGHTHHGGFVQPLDNLSIWTAGADYGRPNIAAAFDLGQLSLPEPGGIELDSASSVQHGENTLDDVH